jgi:prepilin-type processing-associated H-X9-DG protein
MLLPALSKAKAKAHQIECLNHQKQLALAVQLYFSDNSEWFPPIQERLPALGGIESSWRPYLFDYVGRNPVMFDCPVEKVEQYAKAGSAIAGQFVAGEISKPSGLGAVNVHWESGGAQPPFGRPAGYENNLCRSGMVEAPVQLILFGDGNSDIYRVWPNDRWWIWKEVGSSRSAGFNRAAQRDPGAFRHSGKSNYAMADGHAALLDPGKIPCNTAECWWSAKRSPH